VPAPSFDWSELPAEDVLLRLQQLKAQGALAQSGFLDTHQWCRLAGTTGLVLAGGHAQAQFRRAILDDTAAEVASYSIPLASLPSGIRTARQLRGWLRRQGIASDMIGDIVVGEQVWIATAPGALADLPLEFDIAPSGIALPVTEELRATAASARLDAVVGALFHVSRGEAQTAIKYDFVFLNFAPAPKPSHQLRAGDQLVYRTKGRAELLQLVANVRSGRLWVNYRFYGC
jgi:RNA-binding protein YlmH